MARADAEARAEEAKAAVAKVQLLEEEHAAPPEVWKEVTALSKQLAETSTKLKAEQALHESLMRKHEHDIAKLGNLENSDLVLRAEVNDLREAGIQLESELTQKEEEIAVLRAVSRRGRWGL